MGLPAENIQPIKVVFEPAFRALFEDWRYKVYFGGRGGCKSWSFARALVTVGAHYPLLALCTRELQSSIADSVYRLLCDQIHLLKLADYYHILKTTIRSYAGTEIIFKGLKHNIQEIKSTEGIDICWVEEAQKVSKESWEILIPTIRKPGSQIWVSFNTGDIEDPTYQRFIVNRAPDSYVRKVGWQDNPHFPETLDKERRYLQSVDPKAYMNIWEGEPREISEASILGDKYIEDVFDTPSDVILRYGADWGFATDPVALIRSFILNNKLFIDYEAYEVGVELDHMKQFFERVPDSRRWPIRADFTRPETISHVRRRGFKISAAPNWKGATEDAIAYFRKFEKIVVHSRCTHTLEEVKFWSYKVDKDTGKILPEVDDTKFDHLMSALRYAYADEIRSGYVIYSGIWSDEQLFDDDTFPVGLMTTYERRYIGISYSEATAVVFLDIIDDGRTLWVMREFYWSAGVENQWKSPSHYAQDMKEFLKDVESPHMVISEGLDTFRQALIANDMIAFEIDKYEPVEGIRMVSSMMKRRLIRIHKDCINLRSEINLYSWSDKALAKGEEKAVAEFGSALTALRDVIKSQITTWRIEDENES